MATIYDRETDLKNKLNGFLETQLDLPADDYHARLSADGLLQLKSLLGGVNNLFTLKLTLAFVSWVGEHLGLDEQTRAHLKQQVLSTKANANGFDVELAVPINLIAEVKCNLPVKGGVKYGAAQASGIRKDIDALLDGKEKSAVNPADYLKFMVFLDKLEVREATAHLVRLFDRKERLVFLDEGITAVNTDKVYILFLEI